MDTSSSAHSGSPDRESITFTPVQNKFRGFIPRIIGLSPTSILSESADDEYEEKDLQGLFGLGYHPAVLNIPSIPNDLLFPRGILVSDPGAIKRHMVTTFSETDPAIGVTSPDEAPTRILKIGNIQNIAAPILFKIIQVLIPEAI